MIHLELLGIRSKMSPNILNALNINIYNQLISRTFYKITKMKLFLGINNKFTKEIFNIFIVKRVKMSKDIHNEFWIRW